MKTSFNARVLIQANTTLPTGVVTWGDIASWISMGECFVKEFIPSKNGEDPILIIEMKDPKGV